MIRTLFVGALLFAPLSQVKAKTQWYRRGPLMTFSSGLSPIGVHRGDAFASRGTYRKAPVVYSKGGRSGPTIVPIFDQLKGLPKSSIPSGPAALLPRYRRRKLSGKHFTWDRRILVYYDGQKGVGAYYAEKRVLTKRPGVPTCPNGQAARYRASEASYHCPTSGTYLSVKQVMHGISHATLLFFHTKTGRILQLLPLGTGHFQPVGINPQGTHLFLGQNRIMSHTSKVKGALALKTVDLTRRIVTEVGRVPFPTRVNHGGAYAIRWFANGTFTTFFVCEFDEPVGRSGRGRLTSPRAQGAVLQRGGKRSPLFTVPLEIFTAALSPKGQKVYITSYRTGRVSVYNVKKRRITRTKRLIKKTFLSHVTKGGRYLYTFTPKGMVVFSLPRLQRAHTVLKSRLFGARFTTSGSWLVQPQTDTVVFGILPKSRSARKPGERSAFPFTLLR